MVEAQQQRVVDDLQVSQEVAVIVDAHPQLSVGGLVHRDGETMGVLPQVQVQEGAGGLLRGRDDGWEGCG